MRETLQSLLLAALLTVTVAVGGATAQTIVVMKAPPGAPVEVGLNATVIAKAVADGGGIATLPIDLTAHGRKASVDVRIFVDVCDPGRRVTLVESGYEPAAPGAGCTRKEIFGVFLVQKITTVVASAGSEAQAVWIRQGPAPEDWLKDAPVGETAEDKPAPVVATGLVMFGAGGLSNYSRAAEVSCGYNTSCASDETQLALRLGGEYWVRPFFGVSVSYLRPGAATTDGSGFDYRFNSSLKPNVVTIAGKVGAPLGRFRIYGEVGTAYNWTTLSTSETIEDRTLTLGDGSTVVVAGGTQQFELKTDGWDFMWTGGGEFWLTKTVAAFGELSWVRLSGKASGGGEGELRDTLVSLFVGIRFRLAGRS